MSVYVHNIDTVVPETSYSQQVAGEKMTEWTRDRKAQRYISKIYRDSGIENRFSVIPDLSSAEPKVFFEMGEDGYPIEPSTALRNEIFVNESKKMFVDIAEKLVSGCPGIDKDQVTHVITVSCTGFYNPGPDIQIIQGLGLRQSTERYNIGFMGCYGAFPAMRMAKQFCEADPEAVVLVVCLEYCTLHLQLNGDLDSIVANSVFADGAAGLIVSAKEPESGKKTIRLDSFASSLVTEGAEDMAWTVGDRGFDIVLSKYVPRIIGANIEEIVSGLLENSELNIDQIDRWAVHPGGKSILDKVQHGLDLEPAKMEDSREVLREFGNMSSATVLFVLKRVFEQNDSANICAMAFGPGLSVESSFLSIVGG